MFKIKQKKEEKENTSLVTEAVLHLLISDLAANLSSLLHGPQPPAQLIRAPI
jgi:hypothetical protein